MIQESNNFQKPRRRRKVSAAKAAEPEKDKKGGFSIPKSPVAYWNMFVERWWVGLPVGIICGVGLAIFLMQPRPPQYTTGAAIKFENRYEAAPIALPGIDAFDNFALRNHLEYLRSQKFINYIVNFLTDEEKELIQRGYFDPEKPDSAPPSVYGIIRGNMRLKPRPETSILDIITTNQDPEAAKFVANTIALRYIDFNAETGSATTNTNILKLNKLERDWKRKVEQAQVELTEYRKQYNISRLDENQNTVLMKESTLKGRLVDLQTSVPFLQSQVKKLEELQKTDGDLYSVDYIAAFGGVEEARKKIESLEQRRTILEEKYFERHPKMEENALFTQETKLQYESEIERAIASLYEELKDNVALEREYSAELDKVKTEARALDAIQHRYELMDREYNETYANWTNIIKRIEQEHMAEKTDVALITLFEPAGQPSSPVETSLTMVLIQSGAVGFVIWLIIPIGIGLLDTRLKASSDVEDLLGYPLLAAIPRMSKVPTAERPYALLKNLDDGVCEAFRGLYSQMALLSKVDFPKRILLTSTIPNEGKSLVLNNMATTFAMHGKKTLLVDCDFRRPTLNHFHKEGNSTGILKWLISETSENSSLLDNPYLGIINLSENLDLLKSGGRIKNPTEYFDKIINSGLLDQLNEHYDVIFIDTPPVGIFPDALLLSEFADEVIYVCRFNKVKRSGVRKMMRQFRTTNSEPVGLIMNDVPISAVTNYEYDGYGSYRSSYYKSYYKKAAKTS